LLNAATGDPMTAKRRLGTREVDPAGQESYLLGRLIALCLGLARYGSPLALVIEADRRLHGEASKPAEEG
jgi:hypothetical protein